MKKHIKNLLILLLFIFAVWTAGCTPDKTEKLQNDFLSDMETSDVAPDAAASAAKNVMQETTSQEQTAAKEAAAAQSTEAGTTAETQTAIAEDGSYTSKDDVALYLHTYGRLPSNFITKKEAQALGWSGGGLDEYSYGACIGGDKFGNYEGNLPAVQERQYYECDIDTMHADKRGAKRIVFSDDGLIYYTQDHYNTFELLYSN